VSLHDPPDRGRERQVLAAIAAVALLTLLYSLLVAQTVLAWFAIAIPLVVLYLLWRFVLAHERIAAALEAGVSAETDRARGSAGTDDGAE
jgi:hypothetical protein